MTTEKKKTEDKKEEVVESRVDVGMNPIYAGVIAVVCAVGLLLGIALILPQEASEQSGSVSDPQIVNVAYEASKSIIDTAEKNIGIDVLADAGTVITRTDGYEVSFPVSGSSVYTELRVSLDDTFNLAEIGFNGEMTSTAVFLSIISVDNEKLEYCAQSFVTDELIGNIIQSYYEAPSFTPGAQVHLSISKYIKCDTISFPYGLKITPEYVEVTVMNGVSAREDVIEGVIASEIDVSAEEIQEGIYLEINRLVNETTIVQDLQPLSIGYGILPPEVPSVAEGGNLLFQL